MRIAYAVGPEQPVPPPKYGGNEKQTDIIVRRLSALGHKVDLYCGPNSTCPVHKLMVSQNNMRAEDEMLRFINSNLADYDIVIDMTAFHLSGQQKSWPVVSIMTGDPFMKYPHDSVRNRVYVSKEFAAHNGCPDHPVLHNIIHENPSSIKHSWEKKDYALYVGMIREEKGVHTAIKICETLNIPLKIGGPIHPQQGEYWEKLKDSPCVEYLGVVDNNSDAKWKLFGEAKMFLYPISWCDAGPLAPMEAMLAGTPVVSFAEGGICTDIINGVNGYLCSSERDFAEKTIKTYEDYWSSEIVHHSILKNIDPDKYVSNLLALCQLVIDGETW